MKEDTFKFGWTQETIFCINLTKLIDDKNITITKTDDQFCSVDFIIQYKNKRVMLELKSRRQNLSKYSDLFINTNKLHTIESQYKNIPTLLVWSDTFSNVYFTTYNEKLLQSPTQFSNGGCAFKINKKVCLETNELLVDTIKTMLFQ